MRNESLFLQALHLSDTSFPTGAFAYSDGLESAVSTGSVTTAANLLAWLRFYIHNVFTPCDGLALRLAMATTDREVLGRLDAELTAMKPAAALRSSSASQGRQFLRTILGIHASNASLQLATDAQLMNLPVIYGVVCHALGHDTRDSLLAFGYTRLAGTTSAALRLMAIGQQQAHGALSQSLLELPGAVDRIMSTVDERPSAFTPTLDIHQMNHRYLYSRLFRS